MAYGVEYIFICNLHMIMNIKEQFYLLAGNAVIDAGIHAEICPT
jgi:hypothetical protein